MVDRSQKFEPTSPAFQDALHEADLKWPVFELEPTCEMLLLQVAAIMFN